MAAEKKIVIIDYGLGNIYSINQACQHFGYNPIVSSKEEDILSADSLILPGVGAFKVAIDQLNDKGLVDPILEFVKTGKPMMGVCLGMQLLFDESEEFGLHKGLGLIPGSIRKFPSEVNGQKLRVPNIGWNKNFEEKTGVSWDETPLKETKEDDFLYFIHSFYADPKLPESVLSTSDYQGFKYCSSVKHENVYGFQFHPEKSGEIGLSIFKNFLKL